MWRLACREVLKDLVGSEHSSKVQWPAVSSYPQDMIAKSFEQVRAALDEKNKSKQAKYTDTEHFVCDVVRLLRLAMAAHSTAHPVSTACNSLLELFKSSWQDLGEDKESATATDKRFFIYVDLQWEAKQGFRLFEVHGLVEDRVPSKAYVQAREWRVANDLEGGGASEQQHLRMVARTPKTQKLTWTPRRDLQGILQTETMCVKVSAADDGDDSCVAVVVERQGKTVALAYARLHALRALQASMGDAAAQIWGGEQDVMQQDDDTLDAGAPGIDGGEDEIEEMSDYELARLRRMEENTRLLQATGIMDTISLASKQVESLSALQDSKQARSNKKKRSRALEGADEGADERVRGLRSKVHAHAQPGELDKSFLSDVDTPLKSDTVVALPPPAQLTQEQQNEEQGAASTDGVELVEGAHTEGPHREDARNSSSSNKELSRAVLVAERPFPADGTYTAKEDETPRVVAKIFGLDLQSVIKLNKQQYPTLTANARLRKGTQLRLPKPGDVDVFIPSSKLDEKGQGWFAYCHWTYPDQLVEDIHPSYMMVRKLERRVAEDVPDDSMLKKLAPRRVQVPPKIKSPQQLLEEAHVAQKQLQQLSFKRPEGWPDNDEYVCGEDERPLSIAKKLCLDVDKLVGLNRPVYPTLNKTAPLKAGTKLRLPPPIGSSADAHFERADWWAPCNEIVSKLKSSRGAHPFESAVDWEDMGLVEYPFIITQPMDLGTVEHKLMNDMYVSAAQVERDLRLVFENAMHFNQPDDPVYSMASKTMKLFTSLWSHAKLATVSPSKGGTPAAGYGSASAKAKKPKTMFNKVVEIQGGPAGYYFVLHYIPDMQWCHLAEMGQFGLFPKTLKNGKPHAFADKPQWKLLPEGQGAELDVSADRCRVVKCLTVNRSSDADKEVCVCMYLRMYTYVYTYVACCCVVMWLTVCGSSHAEKKVSMCIHKYYIYIYA